MKKVQSNDTAIHRKERRVTWQHKVTGLLFTKLIPESEPIPDKRNHIVVKVEKV